MKRLLTIAVIASGLMMAINANAQNQPEDKSKRPSPPDTVTQKINSGATITIAYSQPSVKGRTIGKDLEPMDGKVWRTGANVNLVTDGLPALALGLEPAEADTMLRPPYRPNENIFSRGLGRHVIWVSILMALLSLGPGYWYWRAGDPNWQTMLFTTLTLSQMAHVMAIRSERQSLFKTGLMSNKPLLAAVSLTLVLQLALVYVPFLQVFFKTNPLPLSHLMLTMALSAVIFAAVEVEKLFARHRQPEMR